MADRAKKLPGNVNHLQKLVGAAAGQLGMPPARLQHWLNSMVVTAVLDRVRDADGRPIFLLKGGVAMELRLELRARATRDYDAAFRARAEEVLDHLDAALADEYNSFTVTREAAEPVKDTDALRVRLRISYKGRSWGSVKLELAPVEGNMGTELDRVNGAQLDALQVPVPETVACVSVRYQVAQKLHACTEVFGTGPENDRFRDVIDILLVEDLLRNEVGLARTGEACKDIFAVRAKHAWPPTVTVYDSWREPFAALAKENGFTPENIDDAVAELSTLIADIDAARPPVETSPAA